TQDQFTLTIRTVFCPILAALPLPPLSAAPGHGSPHPCPCPIAAPFAARLPPTLPPLGALTAPHTPAPPPGPTPLGERRLDRWLRRCVDGITSTPAT
ncbi:hypothetical protein EHS86_18400, partial [Erwinia amylovora]